MNRPALISVFSDQHRTKSTIWSRVCFRCVLSLTLLGERLLHFQLNWNSISTNVEQKCIHNRPECGGRYDEIVPVEQLHLPVIPHRKAGVNCDGTIVPEQEGESFHGQATVLQDRFLHIDPLLSLGVRSRQWTW